MLQSKLFFKPKKEAPKEAETISHKLLLRADFIDQTAAGVYSFLPLGFRVLKKIEKIIREEMVKIGGEEVLLPVLGPKALWQKTKRWKEFEPPLFKLKDRHQRSFCLSPTHEEVITELVAKRVKSYKDLPQSLFQIQDKFRNEIRPTGGLLRTKEFLMKDLYSFHQTAKEARMYYQVVKRAYFKIYKRCGLTPVLVEAETGAIGGSLSHEFIVPAKTGEDKILICQKCGFGANIEKAGRRKKCPNCQRKLERKTGIEIGHTFYLGTKYSEILGANYVDKKGRTHPIEMGCYGIGLGRLMATIVEIHHDQKGIIWPEAVAPFLVHLIPIETADFQVRKTAENLYKNLQKEGIEVLYDQRETSPGVKFADSDLIGIPQRVVVSKKTLKKGSIELKKRDKLRPKLIKIRDLKKYFTSKNH
jgi:prolyl-tRNA synthetase